MPNQANVALSWKQEVNQRIAAHKDRRLSAVPKPDAALGAHHTANARAAAAAARVAARFAKAPSYSEQLAGEARAAVRAAEAASKAALEAQAAAESVLAGLEAATAEEMAFDLGSRDPGSRATEVHVEGPAEVKIPVEVKAPAAAKGRAAVTADEPAPADVPAAREGFEIRWEPDLPQRQANPAAVRATHGAELPEADAMKWQEPVWPGQAAPAEEAIEVVEPGQPIHANLIEFPREIVATRKVRPRRAEGPYAASEGQLSIFEVDPGSVSTEPAAAAPMEAAPAWTAPEWSGIELDAQPERELPGRSSVEAARELELEAVDALERNQGVELAPMNRRMMAAVVNATLVVAVFLAAAYEIASKVKSLPPLREIEVVGAVALAMITVFYHLLFNAFTQGTPGMKYAGVSLCTFDGQRPTRAQRFGRLAAMLVSVLPMGLGVMWAVFDDDHLSWHDRLSQTYLRKS